MATRILRPAQAVKTLRSGPDMAMRHVNRVIRFRKRLMGRLPTYVGDVYSGGEVSIEDRLFRLQEQWRHIEEDPIMEPCPLTFTEAHEAIHEDQLAMWARSVGLMA